MFAKRKMTVSRETGSRCDRVSAMNVYLCHNTALCFFREWSLRQAVSLRAFHDSSPSLNGLLPHSSFSATSVLRSPMTREGHIRQLLRESGDPILRAIEGRCAAQASPSAGHKEGAKGCDCPKGVPLHVLADRPGVCDTRCIVFHRSRLDYPRGSFLQATPHVRICSPELTFVQMAGALPYGSLLALGYELCGCYPVSDEPNIRLVRRPLTTPQRLSAYCERLRQAPGAKLARIAAREVRARSASPKETELAALALAPVRRGGFGLPDAKLNEPIALSAAAAKVARGTTIMCDLYWPQASFGLEYDGRASHGGSGGQTRDSRRRDALALDGIDLLTVTSDQLSNVTECEVLFDHARVRVGKTPRRRKQGFIEKHMALRHDIRHFHQNPWG